MSTLNLVVDALQQTPRLEECHSCENDCSGCHDNGPGGNEEGNGSGLVANLFNTDDIVVEGCTVTAKRFRMNRKQQQTALKTLMEYPLPHVEWRLLKEERVPTDQVPEAMLEWRRFMATILFSDGAVGMISPVVDEVWHAHILFTKEYAQFCQTVFGQFIGHAPNWPGNGGGDKSGATRFLQSYHTLFGNLPAIWGLKPKHECGQSCLDGGSCGSDGPNACGHVTQAMLANCDDCGPGVCGVACYDCNGDGDAVMKVAHACETCNPSQPGKCASGDGNQVVAEYCNDVGDSCLCDTCNGPDDGVKASMCLEGQEQECTDACDADAACHCANGCAPNAIVVEPKPEPRPLCVGSHCSPGTHCTGNSLETVNVVQVCENYSCGDCIDE